MPPTTSAGLNVRCGSTRQRLAKGVEDAGGLEDRAVADVRPEDLRRVRRLPGHGERPGRGPAAADDRGPRVAGAVLEADGDVHAFRRVDKGRARHILRIAGRFLVASHDDRHVHLVERAGRAQGLQGLHDDDVAALHVDDAWAAGLAVIQPLEFLKRTVGLEHGVEVANEKEPAPRARALRHEMAGALERRAVHPSSRESKRVELGREQLPHFADTGMILRAAIDIDGTFEQRKGLPVVRVHIRDEPALLWGQGWLGIGEGRHEDRRDGGSGHYSAREHE